MLTTVGWQEFWVSCLALLVFVIVSYFVFNVILTLSDYAAVKWFSLASYTLLIVVGGGVSLLSVDNQVNSGTCKITMEPLYLTVLLVFTAGTLYARHCFRCQWSTACIVSGFAATLSWILWEVLYGIDYA